MSGGQLRSRLRRWLKAAGVLQYSRWLLVWLSTSRPTRHKRQQLAAFKRALGGPVADRIAASNRRRAFLIYGASNIEGVVGMLPVVVAAWECGYRLVVLLPNADPLLVSAYQACGIEEFVFLEDHDPGDGSSRAHEIRGSLMSTAALKDFVYRGCRTGKFCLSTLMRWSRLGNPDIGDPATDAMLRQQLDASLRAADAAAEIVAAIRPELALFNERGYSPFGELFDTIINEGGECITWNAAHRNNLLMLKRYRSRNVDMNHFALSDESWALIKSMPWSDEKWNRVHDEIVNCYRSGEWFAECATQYNKSSVQRNALAARLGLDPSKRTACVFPHMFWDATFFWGVDLFDNYEHWFTEVLKAARDNSTLNWVIKIHPANVAKATRDGYRGEHSEIVAIRRVLGALPDHIKVIPSESDISTLSLLELTDFCLTVRGTIGIEASCFGIRVLTAGTGRYDRRGFTMDFDSPSDYLEALRNLASAPPMTTHEIELARRFAYGTFLVRPTALSTTRFGFAHSADAQVQAEVLIGSEAMGRAPDVRDIAMWLESGSEDYLAADELSRRN